MRRPVVGVIGNAHVVNDLYRAQLVGRRNLAAVAKVADALPLMFAGSPEVTDVDALLDAVDGILLTGGRANVHPSCFGAEPDRSGQNGITQAKIDAFFTDAAAHVGWAKKPITDAAASPLGDKTAAASAAIQAVQAKVDDYFGRCRLAAFDSRAQALLNRKEEEYLSVAAKDFSISAAEVSGSKKNAESLRRSFSSASRSSE